MVMMMMIHNLVHPDPGAAGELECSGSNGSSGLPGSPTRRYVLVSTVTVSPTSPATGSLFGEFNTDSVNINIDDNDQTNDDIIVSSLY